MSNNIKLKRSSTEKAVPVPADLILGELAINTFDGKLFLKKNNGSDSIETVVTTDAQITGSIEITGAVTASYFSGDGSALTGIPDNNTTYSVGDGGLTTNDFTNADHTKLNGIEASADVTTAANVLSSLPTGTVSGSAQIDHDSTTNFVANEHLDWTSNVGTIHSGNYTDTTTNTQLSQEQVEDFAGAMVASGGTKTGITVTYQDSTGDMDFVVATQTANDFTTTLKNKLDAIELLADVTDATNVLANLPAGIISSSTFPFTGDAQITGSLILSGSAGTVFEVIGSSGSLFEITDSFEGTLFSVADISGIPQFGVTDAGVATIGSTPVSIYTTAQIASTQATTNESVYTLSSSSFDGAWFDYTIISSSNMRAGNVMSIWEAGTTNINFTETTTTDIGDTTGVVISTVITGSEIALRVNTPTDKWKIKTIVRSI